MRYGRQASVQAGRQAGSQRNNEPKILVACKAAGNSRHCSDVEELIWQ